MAGRSGTRNGQAGVFQIADERYVAVRRIPGSPCFMAEECYECDDAPNGWYSSGRPEYVEAATELGAAQGFIELVKSGKVRLLDGIGEVS
jgi:hypothetical protein